MGTLDAIVTLRAKDTFFAGSVITDFLKVTFHPNKRRPHYKSQRVMALTFQLSLKQNSGPGAGRPAPLSREATAIFLQGVAGPREWPRDTEAPSGIGHTPL